MKKLLSLLCLFLVSGCGLLDNVTVYPRYFEKAESVCKANGGVNFLFVSIDDGNYDVYCKNSAIFHLNKEEK